jgi:selenocysteine-specific elongation factor
MRDVIVGTAGHIDHGKSALVLALTGTDPDRLAEEKRRGITIDLGFAHLDLGGGLRVGFVDVPGHERFVRNMLAGASGIDLVMLVVAADESIKPQTREHFEICRLLGIRRGLVVLTKRDLVDADLLETARLEVKHFVAGSFLENAPLVPVSARTGEGLDELREELKRLSLTAEPRPADLPFRLPVDRSFVIHGFGTVVTGTLVAGRIAKDGEAEIFPADGSESGRRVRMRGVQVHNEATSQAQAGQRTALNLAAIDSGEISRGAVLASPGVFQASDRLDCTVNLLNSARPLKNRARVHFHSGTAETLAEIVLLEGREIRPGVEAYAQLRLAAPGLFLPGDHFIIRQFSPVTTIGGGTVMDNRPQRHRAGDAAVLSFLKDVEAGGVGERLLLFVREMGETTVAGLAARLGCFPDQIVRQAQSLAGAGRLVIAGQPPPILVSVDRLKSVIDRILAVLEAFHAHNPLMRGLAKEELRGRLAPSKGRTRSANGARDATPSLVLFGAALQGLSSQGKLEIDGEIVRLTGREVRLSAQESDAKASIGRAFEQAGLAVPPASEVLAKLPLDRARGEKILQILLREKTLVRVSEGLVFHRATLEKLRARLAARKMRTNRLDVAAFKEITGVTRKYAIPLLEYLDRERVTRREGDVRVIL